MSNFYDPKWLASLGQKEDENQRRAEKARRDLAASGILDEYCWDHQGDGLGGWTCSHPSHREVQG